MKRFFTKVTTHETSEGFEIHLDDKPVKTSAKKALRTPYKNVADKIAQEWHAQEDNIVPDTMPMTQIINTQIDGDKNARPKKTEALLKYIDTDLLCYGVTKPEELRKVQEAYWAKWIIWAENKYSVKIKTTDGLNALQQDQKLHQHIAQTIEDMCDDEFAIFQTLVPLSGSILLALAFTASEIDEDDVLKAMFVEEDFKDQIYDADKYGSDPLIEKKKHAARLDLEACRIYRDDIKTGK